MTRDRILEVLDLVVLELANATPVPTPLRVAEYSDDRNVDDRPPTAEEWAYVKGLASGSILRMRSHVAEIAGRP
jgi:hypothetical protein